MSICEDRITEDSTEFEKEFLKIYDGNLWTALDKMKDWQPPMPHLKPYIEVPQFVADWFEEKMGGTFQQSLSHIVLATMKLPYGYMIMVGSIYYVR